MNWKDFPNLNRKGQIRFLTMRDGTKIRTASWPSQDNSRAIIVLVNGHREYMEKYSELISDLLMRNYAVYAFDNRGQGLSDRLLPDRQKSYAEDFGLFSDDLDEFMAQTVMADPRAQELPRYLISHSMGGHICLRYLHDFPGAIEKAVIMAPMVEFNLGNSMTRTVLKFFMRCARRLGFDKSFAMGQGAAHSRVPDLVKQKLLTHDNERYAQEADIIEANPDLYVGGATYGWLNTALDSIEKIHQAGFLEKISIPLLVVVAGADLVVDSKASRDLLSGYDNIDLVTIEGARHEIYRESDQYRDQLWQKIDDFLK
ncbi:MAG: hypothetical protein COB49_03255 [Alphaproteobacteria bacterium]|nr:MAG: hypothetical protein COB49_03255 [Alphaproteobacteria bacterium]